MNWKDDSEQLKSDFVRDGFVVLRGFYSSAEVEALNGYIDQYISEAIPKLPSTSTRPRASADCLSMYRR